MTAKLHVLLMSIYNGRSYGKLVKFWWAVEGTTYRGRCKSLLCAEMTLTFQAFLGCAPHPPRLIYA